MAKASTEKQRRKGWLTVLVWAASVIVVLGVSGLFVVNYAIDRFIESMAGELTTDITFIEPDEGTELTADSASNQNAAKQSADAVEGNTVDEKAEDNAKAVADTAGTINKKQSEAAFNSAQSQAAGEITAAKAKEIQEEVTSGDKAKVASILLKRLSASDISTLKDMASGGLTVEEKKAAKAIILEKMTPEEYNELSQIAKKYGASQGGTYEQAIKD